MYKIVYCLVLIFFITGCSSAPSVSRYIGASEAKHEEIQNYNLNEIMKAYVGQALIEKGTLDYIVTSQGKYKALFDITISSNDRLLFENGGAYPILYKDRNDDSLYVGSNHQVGLKIDENGYILHKSIFYHNIGGWQDNLLAQINIDIGTKAFDAFPSQKIYSPKSFKSEIIYLGMSGDDIKVSYREYKDDVARPAFYQELSYNLKKSAVIRYKNFRIKVLSVNNEEIEYIVLED
ncbi:MAG: hypothetical protein AB7D03_07970 [Thiomicrospira sp.]